MEKLLNISSNWRNLSYMLFFLRFIEKRACLYIRQHVYPFTWCSVHEKGKSSFLFPRRDRRTYHCLVVAGHHQKTRECNGTVLLLFFAISLIIFKGRAVIFAGTPIASIYAGTSRVTIAPAATSAPSPMQTPGSRVAFAPIAAPFRICGPFSPPIRVGGYRHWSGLY